MDSSINNPTAHSPLQTKKDRRIFLKGAGTLAMLGAASSVFAAAGSTMVDHSKHGHKYPGLVGAAQTCANTGDACLSHCFRTFKTGDTSLAKCAVLIDDTIAVCEALASLAVNDSSHTVHMAGVCKGVCEDCEKECLKHAKKHAICQDMADACNATIKECQKAMG